MSKYIVHKGRKFLIRGPYTATELRELYKKVVIKYPKLSFIDFLNRGKVHCQINPR